MSRRADQILVGEGLDRMVRDVAIQPLEGTPHGSSRESLKPGDNPDSYPPGTGPYRFVSWKRGQQMVLHRFNEYGQKGLPKTEEVVLKPDSNPQLDRSWDAGKLGTMLEEAVDQPFRRVPGSPNDIRIT